MKIIDAIRQVDRSHTNSRPADVDEFAKIFDIHIGYSDEFGKRVTEHPLSQWRCTDTWVGRNVYYMDDEPVAVSMQTARKNDINIQFISKATANKIRDFILTIFPLDDINLSIIDPDEDIGDGYSVNYGAQLLVYAGNYKNMPVTVTGVFNKYSDINLWGKVEVSYSLTSDPFVIDISDLNIPYKLSTISVD